MSTNLSFSKNIEAPPEAVYYNFTNSTAIRGWLCDNGEVDAKPGGRIYLHWNRGYYAVGEFAELEKDRSISFTWQGKGEPGSTQVQVTLAPAEQGTHVTLVHAQVGKGDEWKPIRDELSKGWEIGLANLKSVLETGRDKRIFDQPFLGILIAGLIDEKQAEKLGVPVNTGVRISGAMPGTGAAAAGLQADDVVHKLAGVELDAFPAFQVALAPYKAGDTVPVLVYRDGREMPVEMELSHRPAPEVPDSPAELAEAVRQARQELDQQLDEILDGVSDEQANSAPAEGEWSALQVLAHLVLTERAVQMDLACRLDNQSMGAFPGNLNPPLDAMIATHPTLEKMVALWKAAEAETVALAERLPDDVVSRKLEYFNFGQTLLQGLPLHTQGHYDQIQDAIAAVRG